MPGTASGDVAPSPQPLGPDSGRTRSLSNVPTFFGLQWPATRVAGLHRATGARRTGIACPPRAGGTTVRAGFAGTAGLTPTTGTGSAGMMWVMRVAGALASSVMNAFELPVQPRLSSGLIGQRRIRHHALEAPHACRR